MLGNNLFRLPCRRAKNPIVLDMACSVAARGKIIVAAKDSTPIPDDWAIGPDGQATTDPAEALRGFMLPVGGPKGYSLTLVIGLLSTMLSGAGFGSEVTDMYEDLEGKQNIGHLFGVLPIACFEPLETYKARIDKAIREIRGVPRAPMCKESICGGARTAFRRGTASSGIPIKQPVWAELLALGKELGVVLQN